MSTPTAIIVKGDTPSVIYQFVGEHNQDGEPISSVHGVPARDLTEFDLAAMTASQRLHVEVAGSYKKVGKVPAGLVFKAEADTSDEVVPPVEDAPKVVRKEG